MVVAGHAQDLCTHTGLPQLKCPKALSLSHTQRTQVHNTHAYTSQTETMASHACLAATASPSLPGLPGCYCQPQLTMPV